ncbi:Uncharacterized protein DAT39_020791, partial [Clarias magur]
WYCRTVIVKFPVIFLLTREEEITRISTAAESDKGGAFRHVLSCRVGTHASMYAHTHTVPSSAVLTSSAGQPEH